MYVNIICLSCKLSETSHFCSKVSDQFMGPDFVCADGFLCDWGGGPGKVGEGGDWSEESRFRVIMETAVCHRPGVRERKLRLPLGKVSDESVHQTVTGEGSLAWKHRNCANSSFYGLCVVVLSVIFTLQECFCCLEFQLHREQPCWFRAEKAGWWCIRHSCHMAALFMMSLTPTARHTMAVVTAVPLELSDIDF